MYPIFEGVPSIPDFGTNVPVVGLYPDQKEWFSPSVNLVGLAVYVAWSSTVFTTYHLLIAPLVKEKSKNGFALTSGIFTLTTGGLGVGIVKVGGITVGILKGANTGALTLTFGAATGLLCTSLGLIEASIFRLATGSCLFSVLEIPYPFS